MSSNKSTMSALLYAYGAALEKSNTDEMISLYTDNGFFIARGFEASVGTASLKSSYIRVFSNIKLTIEFELLEVVSMSPEWALRGRLLRGLWHI